MSEESTRSVSVGDINETANSFSPIETSSSESCDSDSGPEVWDDCSEEEFNEIDRQSTTNDRGIIFILCLFLNFFQLCYQLSDRAMSHLLLFLSLLLQYLSSYTPSLVTLARSFPKTLYSLRKDLNLRASYTTYIVCTRCHSLYSESECVLVRGSLGMCSQKCRHVEYPKPPTESP